jgi:general secretion pathway protein F
MRYELKALRDGDGVIALSLDAPDQDDAVRQAKSQRYTVLAIKPKRCWPGWRAGRGAHFPLTLFSQELLTLLNAGLTLVEAVETLAEKEDRSETGGVLRQVIARLYEGHPLSFALRQFPAQFSSLYIATVRASEKTGDLSVALSRYVSYQERIDVVRTKVVSAAIYPVLLLSVGGLVTLFLMAYVVPKFSSIYEEMGSDLPLFSKLLMGWGQALQAHGLVIVSASVALLAALAYGITRPAVKRWLMHRLWQVPAVGNRMKIYQLARFYRTIGMLQQGGTPIVTALQMASDLLQSSLRGQLLRASNSIREGMPISRSMEQHGLTTPVAFRMLAVGERTGQMGEMMDRIAGFYDDEMARWVDWFTKLFEPLLMAFIGLVIGVIVMLMYFPIFELAGSIQ